MEGKWGVQQRGTEGERDTEVERDRKRRREGARKGGNKEEKLKYPSRGIQL